MSNEFLDLNEVTVEAGDTCTIVDKSFLPDLDGYSPQTGLEDDSNQRRSYSVKVHMSEPTLDIFSGTSDRDARWLESIQGLSKARGRMERLAEVRPGAYFLYDPLSHSILAKSDTTKQLQFETQEK